MNEREGYLTGIYENTEAEESGNDRDMPDAQLRLKNLFWTVSGDYGLETEVDTVIYKKSEPAALYDAIRKGCFSRYFKPEVLEQYLYKAELLGAEPSVLNAVAKLCVESAVWKKAVSERAGIGEMRRQAFRDILEKEKDRLTHTDWGDLEAGYLEYSLYGTPAGYPKQCFIDKICALSEADDTVAVVRCIDEVYNDAYEKGFADRFKGIGLVSDSSEKGSESEKKQEEANEERIVNLLQDSAEQEDDGENKAGRPETVVLADESMAQAMDYIDLNYGKSYLSGPEQKHLTVKLCTGIHKERRLHFTDGLLYSESGSTGRTLPVNPETFQMEYAARVRDENLGVLKKYDLITRQNILSLADTLKRALLTRDEKETFSGEYGRICIPKLWNPGRTGNRKLFEREFIREYTDFAVEVLIDSSGSQQIRQSMVALQGYIVSAALSMAGLPHRVMGFCTFGDYTVMRRFRDYDEPETADLRLMEFYGSANNRDGLAVRAAAHSLMSRKEEKKILIILSDGMPNDIITGKSKSRDFIPYCNAYAVKDTAREIWALRSKNIAVMGIFAGEEEALPAEKQIFGNEFAYIRNITGFSNVVGRYLKERIIG